MSQTREGLVARRWVVVILASALLPFGLTACHSRDSGKATSPRLAKPARRMGSTDVPELHAGVGSDNLRVGLADGSAEITVNSTCMNQSIEVTNLPPSLSENPQNGVGVRTVTGRAPIGSSVNGIDIEVIFQEVSDQTNCYGRTLDQILNLPVKAFSQKLTLALQQITTGRLKYEHLKFTPPVDLNSGTASNGVLEVHLVGYDLSNPGTITLQWDGGSHDYPTVGPESTQYLKLAEAPDAANHLQDITIILPYRTAGPYPLNGGADWTILDVK
jgi:hypothetical protein